MSVRAKILVSTLAFFHKIFAEFNLILVLFMRKLALFIFLALALDKVTTDSLSVQ
jgi:hypothetical protein